MNIIAPPMVQRALDYAGVKATVYEDEKGMHIHYDKEDGLIVNDLVNAIMLMHVDICLATGLAWDCTHETLLQWVEARNAMREMGTNL